MSFPAFTRYLGIILYRTIAGIKSEARQNYLGYFWFLLEPMLSTVVLYIAFTQITGQSGPGYAISLIVGLITWQWFESSCVLGAVAIKMKYGVLSQFNLPKYIFPLVSIFVNTWKFLCVSVVVMIAAAAFGYLPNKHYIYLPLLLILQLILITGVTLPLSIGATLMNDLLTVVSSVFRLFFFLSGIFFSVEHVPENLKSWFFANPMAVFINSYRDVIVRNQAPDFGHLGMATAISVGLLILGLALHMHYDKRILKLTNV